MNTRENYSDFSFNPGELSNFDMTENGRFPQFLYKTTLSEGVPVVQEILCAVLLERVCFYLGIQAFGMA